MSDAANDEVERLIKKLTLRLDKEYKQAAKEVAAKLKDYQRRFAIKNRIKLEALAKGIITPEDYAAWYAQQVLVEGRWNNLATELASDMVLANAKAKKIVVDYQIDAYAENHAYETYLIESTAGINTSYTLYSHEAIERLVRDDPKLLPDPGRAVSAKIAAGKAALWNRQEISSIAMQSILQGESIPKIASRMEKLGASVTAEDIRIKNAEKYTEDELANKIASEVARKNRNAAIRNARTMMTGAQNAGRMDAAVRATNMGVKMVHVWLATLDMRTRHAHRVLDGQRREIGEPFEVEGDTIRYPGDPEAPPHQVYNCRCTLVPQIKGFEYDVRGFGIRNDPAVEGMSYEEWKENRTEKPNPITLPEQKAAAIRGAYIGEYKRLVTLTKEADD